MKNIIRFIISVLIPILIGFTASFFTVSGIDSWYVDLVKPFFNPPNWIFGPVWTILYIMIGISFYLVWKEGFGNNKTRLLVIYFIQLSLNFAWSFSFFYFGNPLLGLINIILLLIFIGLNIKVFYDVKKWAGYLLIPYLLWVMFATVLNFSIFILN
ncbi:tryptophan-rich sensory protein [Candidatus Gracilibacteria bacterium]|nr:tryptophan-rich sensory protein [Candidatus Gracilibacteria bacterium]